MSILPVFTVVHGHDGGPATVLRRRRIYCLVSLDTWAMTPYVGDDVARPLTLLIHFSHLLSNGLFYFIFFLSFFEAPPIIIRGRPHFRKEIDLRGTKETQ